MDRLDYLFKFSTEIVVATLSVLIIAINLAGAHNLEAFNKNLLAKLLSYHPGQNPGLYSKSTTIKTVVGQEQNFIPLASAQVVLASADLNSGSQNANIPAAEYSIIADNSIQKENPDSVRGLIADQIKVYDTKNGDTLKSIANKFGISTDTIIWANNLKDSTIKPGWNLVILPTSGVLHKVTNNDTLPDIAKKYKAEQDRIISYNNLLDDSDIEPGDLLIIPDGVVPTPPKPIAPVKRTIQNKTVYEPAPGGIEDYGISDGHIFPWGQCTWWVAKKRYVPWGGNAKNWLTNAAAYGASIGSVPTKGSIVVTTENRRYGHVAYVEYVDQEQRKFLVSEMNYLGKGKTDERWLSFDAKVIRGFIY